MKGVGDLNTSVIIDILTRIYTVPNRACLGETLACSAKVKSKQQQCEDLQLRDFSIKNGLTVRANPE